MSALFMGNLSDRFGHRKVIIPAIIVFSLLAGFSGLAVGALSLMLIRGLIGFAEGAYTPSSIVATLDASKPTRQGRNIGIQQAALPLFGLGYLPSTCQNPDRGRPAPIVGPCFGQNAATCPPPPPPWPT